MSCYVKNYLSQLTQNAHTAVSTTIETINKFIVLSDAQEAPRLVANQNETNTIVAPNHGGGMSFDITKTFDQAVLKNDIDVANRCLITMVERLATLGTCDMRVDINATKMTDDARQFFYKCCAYNLNLVVSTINNVYITDRAPKVSHVIYLIALLTSVVEKDAGSPNMMIEYRSKGYSLVPIFRITTHLFEWINTHITLCSAHGKQIEDDKIASAPGLILSKNKHENRSKRNPRSGSKLARKGGSKLARKGGTGAGFRRAITEWYLKKCSTPENAKTLAIQITKYFNRHNFTHADVLSLIHIKMTSKKKCDCRKKTDCKCPEPITAELKNIIPVAGQIPLAYANNGIQHATKILLDGIDRLIFNGGNPECDNDILCAFKVFAFLSAVEKAKNDNTSIEDLCDLIRKFRLTREMVSNSKLNNLLVLCALTEKVHCSSHEIMNAQRELLLSALPTHTLINKLFTDNVDNVDNVTNVLQNELQIGMPITALIRNVNNLTSGGLFDPSSNPRANEFVYAITNHLTNTDVLRAGHVHPINLFNAHSVYSKGKGFLGSKTWTPVVALSNALIEATEMAFKGLEGLNCSIAFLIDASGSMSLNGSAPGMPCLTALDIAVLLVLTFYRATVNYANANGKSIPNHCIGYFGKEGFSQSYTSRAINKMITNTELAQRSASFNEITNKFHPKVTFQETKSIFGNGEHLGMTDVGSAFWCMIAKLKNSLEQVNAKNPMFNNMTVYKLPGYVELLFLVTDNDVNSGDQPMDVLNLYWDLVRQAFEMLPFDKDGAQADPITLFTKYVPRLAVVATQGTAATIGDARDSRIMNVSGFDSNAPAIIESFVRCNDNVA